jgi:hypothetical protein
LVRFQKIIKKFKKIVRDIEHRNKPYETIYKVEEIYKHILKGDNILLRKYMVRKIRTLPAQVFIELFRDGTSIPGTLFSRS